MDIIEEVIPNPILSDDYPFPHVIIDNVLSEESFKTLLDGLPEVGKEPWVKYDNPLELKYALNKREHFPKLVDLMLTTLYGPYIRKVIPLMLKLPDEELFADPVLLGAGVHAIPAGGKLDLHLDHNRNPELPGMERRVNVIYWMHPEWDESWGGDLELWSSENGVPTELAVSILPKPNRMAIFRAGDNAFHGHPDPLTCPPDKHRISLALYYYSNQQTDTETRHKVKFVARPGDANSPELEKLRADRANPATSSNVWRV